MTKEQLERWKKLGFPFDEFYDTIAKDTPVVKPELSIKFVSATKDEKFYTVKLAFNIKNFKSKEATIFLEIDPTTLSYVRFGESKKITFSAESNTFDFKIPVDPFDINKYDGLNFYAKLIYEGLSVETSIFQIGKNKETKTESKETESNLRKDIKELKPSLDLFNFIKEIEKYKNVILDEEGNIIKFLPYDSVEGGSKTIAWGHKIKKGENFDSGITYEEAEALLEKDVESEGVEKLLEFKGDKKINVKLNQNEYDAVISAIYNNGYGESLAAAINNGHEVYSKKPEIIYKGFLKRANAKNPVTKKLEKNRGLIKRAARAADIFLYNKWHSYGASDPKFSNENEYIKAYSKFLDTGILPMLFFLFFLISCNQKRIETDKTVPSQKMEIKNRNKSFISNSAEKALSRIETFDDGIGSNVEVSEKYELEKKSWLLEIDKVYIILHEKIKNEQPEREQEFIDYHNDWKKYLDSKRNFEVSYIENYFASGITIFYIKPYFQEEYRNKLLEYYSLLEYNNE